MQQHNKEVVLYIKCPLDYEAERRYICNVIFSEFLGINVIIQFEKRRDVRIVAKGQEGRIVIADHFFQIPKEHYLTEVCMPCVNLPFWQNASKETKCRKIIDPLPVLYGKPLSNGSWWKQQSKRIELGVDIIGSSFFMLTRFEELVCRDRDEHGRFPAKSSVSYRHNFIDRAIINEYLELLWFCISVMWPGIKRKKREFQLHLTHDVDLPLGIANRKFTSVIRSAGADVLIRRDFTLAMRRLLNYPLVKLNRWHLDINNNFDWIMKQSERKNVSSVFNFIPGIKFGIDGQYSILSPWALNLIRNIHLKGHEIGFHPNYNTFKDKNQLKKEFMILRKACCLAGIQKENWGGRQHFLQWKNPTTWQIWEELGLEYDSTLSYADRTGFRCGICFNYPVFNLHTREPLKLREYPLIVMDASLFYYMNLNFEESIAVVNDYIRKVKIYKGNFTLLWHNHILISKQQKKRYLQMLDLV